MFLKCDAGRRLELPRGNIFNRQGKTGDCGSEGRTSRGHRQERARDKDGSKGNLNLEGGEAPAKETQVTEGRSGQN